MPKYDRFIFESFHFDPDTHTVALNYSLDDVVFFQEVISIKTKGDLNTTHPDLPAALFALHLAGGASYYKIYCPRTIEVRSGQLNPEQAKFWNTLYTHGLGEFFYQNQLDFHGLIQFPATTDRAPAIPPANIKQPRNALVPFGGGKDSVVTTQLLNQLGIEQTLFRVQPHQLITQLAATAQLPLAELTRTLSPELFKLQEAPGAYKGHVPITAYISFLSICYSLLAGFDSIFFSNERSSSYGNVEYLGMTINHQWSKSLEAEIMLRNYITSYVTTDVQYLNLLRPLSELHIARLFTNYPQFLHGATSCNRNWTLVAGDPHAHHWCGKCPKCAFSFALMTAFLPAATVIQVFQKNLFDDEALSGLYHQLWGSEGFKPFECVGTPEETAMALYLAHTRGELEDTVIMKDFVANILPGLKNPDETVERLFTPELKNVPEITRQLLDKTQL